MGNLFTIGHSNHSLEHFKQMLVDNDVNYVIDVRSVPRSRFVPQFNEKGLSEYLKSFDISYCNMGEYFGARQVNPNYYNERGYLDFECFRESDLFKTGFENILKGLENHNIALMCTEKNPIDCHRAIMVGRGFELAGVKVEHILSDSTVISQDIFNNQLLQRYFSRNQQLSLFDTIKNEDELLVEAYRKRNEEIGYRKKED